MSTDGILEYQGTKRVLFRGDTSNIVFDTRTTSLGIGVTGSNDPSSNLYITGNAYVSSNLAIGGVMTMGVVNVAARHNLQAVTDMGNVTTHTVEFTNPTTSIVASGNVEVGKDLTVSGNVSINGNFSQITTGIGRVPIMGRISNTFLTTSPSILISDLPENVDIDRMKTAAYGAIVMMSGANISSAGKRTPGKCMGFGEVNQSSTYIELAYGFYDGTYTKIVGLRYDIGSSSKSITVKQTFARWYQGNTTRYDNVSWTTQGSTPGSANYGVKDLTIFY